MDKKILSITLCGSLRFRDEILDTALELSNKQFFVMFPDLAFRPCGSKITVEERSMLKENHRQRIDLCDKVLVINKDSYVGDDTKEEIEYAKKMGKEVLYKYINCSCDCTYAGANCRLETTEIPFIKKYDDNAYPDCPHYCEQDK